MSPTKFPRAKDGKSGIFERHMDEVLSFSPFNAFNQRCPKGWVRPAEWLDTADPVHIGTSCSAHPELALCTA